MFNKYWLLTIVLRNGSTINTTAKGDLVTWYAKRVRNNGSFTITNIHRISRKQYEALEALAAESKE